MDCHLSPSPNSDKPPQRPRTLLAVTCSCCAPPPALTNRRELSRSCTTTSEAMALTMAPGHVGAPDATGSKVEDVTEPPSENDLCQEHVPTCLKRTCRIGPRWSKMVQFLFVSGPYKYNISQHYVKHEAGRGEEGIIYQAVEYYKMLG